MVQWKLYLSLFNQEHLQAGDIKSPACFCIYISMQDRNAAAALGEAAKREQMEVMGENDYLINSGDASILIEGTVTELGCTAIWKIISTEDASVLITASGIGENINICLITDDIALASKAHSRHMCTVLVTCSDNYRRNKEEHIADAELSSVDSVSLSFLRMTTAHASGEPFILSQRNDFIIRESVEEDRTELQKICDESSEGNLINEMTSSVSRFEDVTTKAYDFYGFGMWTIVHRPSSEVIGWFGFYPENGQVWISYYLDRKFRGRGMAIRLAQVLLEYAWYEMGLTEVFAAIYEENRASVRLAEKMGFVIREDKKRPLLIMRKSLEDDYL